LLKIELCEPSALRSRTSRIHSPLLNFRLAASGKPKTIWDHFRSAEPFV
jgi:hypothetical protein